MLRALVTGAAGLLGGEVCARLLLNGHTVTGLVHRNREIKANDGSSVTGMNILQGDVSSERFGWDEQQWRDVAAAHDLIVHCAALVRFDLDDDAYDVVNVRGAENAVALAELGNLAFLHVSTAYVCGTRNGPILETDPLPDSGFANGYEASKARGEQRVMASDTRWAIARPSIVVGDYETGAIRQFDTTYAAFKLIAEGRVQHMPATPDATLDFVPIDHVAAGIIAIAERLDSCASQIFHLVSSQPLPVERFATLIGNLPQFTKPQLVRPDAFDPASLPAIERRLYRRIAGLYASYFQRAPVFDDTQFKKMTGLSCRPTGAAYIRRLMAYCITKGFLPNS